jgi:hypothetical protein
MKKVYQKPTLQKGPQLAEISAQTVFCTVSPVICVVR